MLIHQYSERKQSDDQKIQFVLRIKVDEDDIIKRLIDRGRSDDKPEIIKNRFKSYNSETQPLIPFYEERKILFNKCFRQI